MASRSQWSVGGHHRSRRLPKRFEWIFANEPTVTFKWPLVQAEFKWTKFISSRIVKAFAIRNSAMSKLYPNDGHKTAAIIITEQNISQSRVKLLDQPYCNIKNDHKRVLKLNVLCMAATDVESLKTAIQEANEKIAKSMLTVTTPVQFKHPDYPNMECPRTSITDKVNTTANWVFRNN